MNTQNLLPYKGTIHYYPDFFLKTDSDQFYLELLQSVDWKQLPIKIFGREVLQPRLTAWFGDPGRSYTYSGLTLKAQPWTPALLKIKRAVEKKIGLKFNSALLNLYRHGTDSMGWHRDNEKELGKAPVIASVSLGSARMFMVREYAKKENKIQLGLEHGSLLVMSGETQHYWEHSIPKTKQEVGQRINITFRTVY